MTVLGFVKQIFSEFGQDKAGQLSAAFAYVAVFSIGPLLLIIINIVGFIFGEQAANGSLFNDFSDIVGADAARTIQNAVDEINNTEAGIIGLIFGLVGVLLAAVGLTNQLQNSFNSILNVVPDPQAGIRSIIYTKIKNVTLISLASLLIVTSLVLSALISGFSHKLQSQIGLPAPALEFINSSVSLLTFVLILYLIYKVLPDAIIPRKVTLFAALLTGVLFLVGKIILGIIIGKNATAGAYGAAASLVTLLLWFYYSAQIFMLGAEFIKVYGNQKALVYPAKKYNLKRRTLSLDLKSSLGGRAVERFVIGFKKGSQKIKK